MDILLNIIKALFFSGSEEENKSNIARLKNGLLWMILGAGILLGMLLYLADDEEPIADEETPTEEVTYYEQDID